MSLSLGVCALEADPPCRNCSWCFWLMDDGGLTQKRSGDDLFRRESRRDGGGIMGGAGSPGRVMNDGISSRWTYTKDVACRENPGVHLV